MPAFLVPGEAPLTVPKEISSICFLFHRSPYLALGKSKPNLQLAELPAIHFTEGLASLVLLNMSLDRAQEVRNIVGDCPLEYWPLTNSILQIPDIVVRPGTNAAGQTITLPTCDEQDLAVYVEQIAASLSSLWASYGIYFPEERETLHRLVEITNSLVLQYVDVKRPGTDSELVRQRKANAIVSALVELSATLSYAVTQGTSGCAPILWNRSPFPHHSLLGIGGSIRALTRYTRYLETAFMVRSAGDVIGKQYSYVKSRLPASIAKYDSGSDYKFPGAGTPAKEHFDQGGDFTQEDQVPLLAHFSLRHGFMESKFSVTAASESLTAETMPQWTLMTLSHEVMHSRVRTIFQALFGREWNEDAQAILRPEVLTELLKWINSPEGEGEATVEVGLRNVILLFCYAIEQYWNPVPEEDDKPGGLTSGEAFIESYCRHKQLAIEIVVHFHDYYFAYAYQPKMYIMSVWASWIKVAAPFTRTLEYLVRSLATVACGTGLPPRAAFDFAVEQLTEGLDTLEARGIRSPLFAELRRLVADQNEAEKTRAYFKPCYYLIDTVRLYFASTTIASRIDRITTDPFAEGSTAAEDYSASIYVFPEGEVPSPIRYSLAALFRTLSGNPPPADPQWLTAWNYMVISSQENK